MSLAFGEQSGVKRKADDDVLMTIDTPEFAAPDEEDDCNDDLEDVQMPTTAIVEGEESRRAHADKPSRFTSVPDDRKFQESGGAYTIETDPITKSYRGVDRPTDAQIVGNV